MGQSRAESSYSPARRLRAEWWSVAALVLLVAAFVQRAVALALRNWDVARGDQGDYLRLALKVADGLGFTHGNYHPLLAFVLQPWATREWGFFTEAKLVNVAIAAGGLVVVYILGRRQFGAVPALLAAAALAMNAEYLLRSARTEPEALLTLLMFAAWACWTLGFEDWHWWLAAGPLAGLAYLAKGTGQFFLIGFLAVPLLRQGPRGLRERGPWLLVGLYLLVASPLLLDNWRAFGSPFYDFVSAHAMWYDDWDDRYESESGTEVTAVTYFRTHSAREVAGRLGEGLWDMTKVWPEALSTGVSSPGRTVVAVLLVGLAGLGLVGLHRRQVPGRLGDVARWRDAAWTFGALFLPATVFFGWYLEVVSSTRFELPLVPVVVLLLVGLAWAGVCVAAGRVGPAAEPLLATAVAAVIGLAALGAMWQGEWVRPRAVAESDHGRNLAALAVYQHLAAALPDGGKVLWGPGNLARWQYPSSVTGRRVPATVRSLEELQDYMTREGIGHVVLTREMVEERPFLGRFFHVEDRRVIIDAPPPGWSLELSYPPDAPCKYCVFRVERP